MLLGGYSSVPKHNVTVLEGIKARLGDRREVLYSEGCKITVGGSWNEDEVKLSDPEEDRRQIAEAVKVANKADIMVLAIGGNEQTSREAWSFQHLGDRASLDLIGRQEELVDAMLATGKPVVVFLFNGRPLVIESLARKVPVIFECWYLGQETGHAVAEVLFGDFNPGGKLPMTIPRSAGHLPCFYNYKPTARRGYLVRRRLAALPIRLRTELHHLRNRQRATGQEEHQATRPTRVRAEVTNTGKRAGSEVVQMYIRDLFSSVTRPIKELKGFRRVFLDPGETAAVDVRDHAGAVGLLRHPNEVRGRAGRVRNHGRKLVRAMRICRP